MRLCGQHSCSQNVNTVRELFFRTLSLSEEVLECERIEYVKKFALFVCVCMLYVLQHSITAFFNVSGYCCVLVCACVYRRMPMYLYVRLFFPQFVLSPCVYVCSFFFARSSSILSLAFFPY